MKPFNLEAALRGEKFQMKGIDLEIIDFKWWDRIVELHVYHRGNIKEGISEGFLEYDKNGFLYETGIDDLIHTLVMTPVKKKGWINIYKIKNPPFGLPVSQQHIFPTKEIAISNKHENQDATQIEIEWDD